MADSGVVIPYEIRKILDERASLRQELETAHNQYIKIERLVSQVESSTPAQIPSELTSINTPPAEIAAALQYFQVELARLNKIQEEINQYQTEMNDLEYKWRVTVVVVGVTVAIVLAAIAFSQIDFITSLMSNFLR